MELFGEVGERRVGAAKLEEHTAASGVGQGSERSVEEGFVILHHMVQCYSRWTFGVQEKKTNIWLALRFCLVPRGNLHPCNSCRLFV